MPPTLVSFPRIPKPLSRCTSDLLIHKIAFDQRSLGRSSAILPIAGEIGRPSRMVARDSAGHRPRCGTDSCYGK